MKLISNFMARIRDRRVSDEQLKKTEFLYPEIDDSIPVTDIQFWKQHIPDFCTGSQIGFTSPSFQDYLLGTKRGEIHARSMLTQAELALLYALARYHFRGVGHIVDLGPLIGVGTYCFARGLSQNPGCTPSSRVFSYDLFLMENMSHFLPSGDAGGTGSVFYRFIENNRDFLDSIIPVPGDLHKMKWIGKPIEILFIDLSKTWKLNQHVMSEFFPYLIPGHSIVVQQDYVHVGEPWIALTMEILSEYFEHLYFIYGATSVYRLIKPIPMDVLTRTLRDLPLPEMDRHMENAREKAPPAVGEVLKCCQAALRIEKMDLDGASQLIAQVNKAVKDGEDETQEFNPAIRANLNAVSRWLAQARQDPDFTRA